MTVETLTELQNLQAQIIAIEEERAQAVRERDLLVKALRAEGFTQRETAALLGISFQRVSQIERAQT